MQVRDARLGELLGSGASADVHAGEWQGRRVAVKLVRIRHEAELAHFNQEVLAHRRASDAGLAPPLFDSWIDLLPPGPLVARGVLLMGLVEGTLEGLLRAAAARGEAAAAGRRAAPGLRDLLEGLRAVGLQHNDASIANVGYVGSPEAPRWLFIDWGMAQVFPGGAPILESPPHLRRHRAFDPAYDAALLTWSLAWWFEQARAWPAPQFVEPAVLARYLGDTAPRHRWQGLTDATGGAIDPASVPLWRRKRSLQHRGQFRSR